MAEKDNKDPLSQDQVDALLDSIQKEAPNKEAQSFSKDTEDGRNYYNYAPETKKTTSVFAHCSACGLNRKTLILRAKQGNQKGLIYICQHCFRGVFKAPPKFETFSAYKPS